MEWRWPETGDHARAAAIAAALDAPEALGRALAARGFDAERAASLVNGSLAQATAGIGEPAGVEAAAELLLREARWGRIGILCDYDVDGGASQAILIEAFRAIADAGSGGRIGAPAPEQAARSRESNEPLVVVPDREREGFGPNERCLRALADRGASCVVTLDCGTAAGPLLDRFQKEYKLVPVVVDHHPPHGEAAPETGLVLNPWVAAGGRDPGASGTLCTSALAWFLARALLRLAGLSAEATRRLRRRLTTLAALGTVCDVMPLAGFNRELVRAGLACGSQASEQVPGLAAIAAAAGVGTPLGASDLGWRIGPRINAGSRMGESELAARCLRSADPSEAAALAERLDAHNRTRVGLCRGMERELAGRDAGSEAAWRAGPVNVAVSPVATLGVAGLGASWLVKRFGWPAVLLAPREDGLLAGSGRSALGFDLGGAVAQAARGGLLVHGGGHAAACGLAIEEDALPAFARFIADRFRETCPDRRPGFAIDAVLDDGNLAPDRLLTLVEAQDRLEPWGYGFARPVFGVRDCRLVGGRAKGGHLFLKLSADGQPFEAVWWSAPRDWTARLGARVVPNGGEGGPDEAQAGSITPTEAARLAVAGPVTLDAWRDRRRGRFEVRSAARVPD